MLFAIIFLSMNMKKNIALGLVLLLAFSFSGCGNSVDQPANPEQASEEFAEKGPSWTQESLKGFLNRESDAEMSYAGPFYFGSFDGMAPSSQNYSEQRRQIVDDLMIAIDGGLEVANRLDDKLREEREIFAWYISEIQTIDESTKSFTDQVLGATKGSALSEALSATMVLRNNAKKIELSPEWGFMQFQTYGALVKLTDLYSSEAESLVSRTTAMYYLLEADSNTAYQDLNKQFTAKLDPVSDQVSEILSELYYNVAIAGYGQKLLFTADYYFAKDIVAATDIQIAEMKKTIADYDGSNELLSDEMLVLLQKKVADLEAYRNNIVAFLESVPSEELLPENDLIAGISETEFRLVPVANAQNGFGSPGWFQQKISSAYKNVKFVKDMSFAAVRVGGQKIKDAYDKSGAHEFVKDGAQIFNAGLEGVNSTVEVSIHGLQGLYYGDMSWEDFKNKIEAEKKELYERFVAGKLGKDQYDEIIHQVDLFQNATKRFVENTSELSGLMTSLATGSQKAGKFVENVTRSVGNEAKGVIDTATDFSKNLAIVMHPETTKQETREAMLNIYIALQGIKDDKGKLINVEIPDLTDIAKKKAIEEAASTLGLSQEEEKEFKEKLKEMFQNQLKDKESKETTKKDDAGSDTAANTESDTDARTEAVAKILTNPDLTGEEVADLIIAEIVKDLPPVGEKKKAGKKEEENNDSDNDGIENEYDNCEKVSNPEQTDTDMDSLGDACDPDCSGDKDEDEVCDEIDNCPEVANADQKDSDDDGMGNMCDFDPPDISEIAGNWPGTITVREVYVSDELRAQAAADGCDIEAIEESKDVPKPVSMIVNPTSENGGVVMLSGVAGDEAQEIPFTYVNGVLKAANGDDQGSINIEMNFNRSESTGKVDMDYMGGQATIQADIDVSK